MEDPIQFDILVHIRQGRHRDAEVALTDRLGLHRLEVLMRINRATKASWMAIAHGVSWSEVEEFRQHVPDWVLDYSVCQEGYSAETAAAYCRKHDLWYGGCLGCHVCEDFYRKR
jgi:hypothetical protein